MLARTPPSPGSNSWPRGSQAIPRSTCTVHTPNIHIAFPGPERQDPHALVLHIAMLSSKKTFEQHRDSTCRTRLDAPSTLGGSTRDTGPSAATRSHKLLGQSMLVGKRGIGGGGGIDEFGWLTNVTHEGRVGAVASRRQRGGASDSRVTECLSNTDRVRLIASTHPRAPCSCIILIHAPPWVAMSYAWKMRSCGWSVLAVPHAASARLLSVWCLSAFACPARFHDTPLHAWWLLMATPGLLQQGGNPLGPVEERTNRGTMLPEHPRGTSPACCTAFASAIDSVNAPTPSREFLLDRDPHEARGLPGCRRRANDPEYCGSTLARDPPRIALCVGVGVCRSWRVSAGARDRVLGR